MAFKFKDIVNYKLNRANNQQSLDLRKRILKKEGISVEELLELKINKKMLKQIE